MNNKFSFQKTVQSLARVLARIKPTPWPKVRRTHTATYSQSLNCNFFFLARSKLCTVIVHKKMQPEYFAWTAVRRMQSSLWDCISSKVVANMNSTLFRISFVWPNHCPRPYGLTIVFPTKRTVSN